MQPPRPAFHFGPVFAAVAFSTACADGAAGAHYGSTMAEIGRRHEQLGRAVRAARFELAAYQLGEIRECFEETLPRVAPPREGHPEVLPEQARRFEEVLGLRLPAALAARDATAADAAFREVAGACNVCHEASGHGFIVVPAAPGAAVPEVGLLLQEK